MDAQDAAEGHWTEQVLSHPYQSQIWCSMAGGRLQAVLSLCYLAMDTVDTRQHWTPHSWCENVAEHKIHCWEKKKNQHFLYFFACSSMLMVPAFHCCTHQYGKATRPFKLQLWLFVSYLALACNQVSLRMYGKPERERCCIEKCHARQKTFYEEEYFVSTQPEQIAGDTHHVTGHNCSWNTTSGWGAGKSHTRSDWTPRGLNSEDLGSGSWLTNLSKAWFPHQWGLRDFTSLCWIVYES